MKLLPHQAAFVETFFDPAAKRVTLLQGDVGLGKASALVALSTRLLEVRPAARALFLVPSALRMQIVDMLSNGGTRSLGVDRYRFREMLDSTAEGELWPGGVVAVLSLDFAKQPDVRESLAKTRWDLVIVDEAHWLKGARGEAFRQIAARAGRVVLATTPEVDLSYMFLPQDTTVVEWRRDQIIDHDGRRLDAVPRPLLHEASYDLTPAESSLRSTVGDLCRVFETDASYEDLMAKVLLACLHSSPAALEGVLHKIVDKLITPVEVDAISESSVEDPLEDQSASQIDASTAAKTAEIVTRALQEIEAIGGDSKLLTFSGLLNQLKEPSRRTCVMTDYRASIYYLAAEIEGRGMACQVLHGGMSTEDRQRVLELFLRDGGILVATRATMSQGISLPGATDLVLYDLPPSKIALQQVLGRFDRFGRVSQLNVYALTPSNADDFISKPLTLLRELLGGPIQGQSTH